MIFETSDHDAEQLPASVREYFGCRNIAARFDIGNQVWRVTWRRTLEGGKEVQVFADYALSYLKDMDEKFPEFFEAQAGRVLDLQQLISAPPPPVYPRA